MNREEVLVKSDNALKELAEALKQGKSDSLVRYLEMLSKFHRYSFGNCMLIAMQRPDASLVAGFGRWKELHRWVKKGETGIAILAPLVFKRKKKEGDERDEGEEPAQREARTLRGFRVVHVFDVSQTEGKDLPEFATLGGDPGSQIDRLEQVIRDHGIQFERIDTLPRSANGMSEGGKITIRTDLPKPQMFSTMVHELAHELLHQGDRREATTKVVRETEAEAVAFVVSRSIGLECSTRASDYIQLWSGDEKVLMQSLELIRDVATRIITALETNVSVEEEVAHVA